MSYKYFLFWLPMIVLAVANGSLRQFVFLKHVHELTAYQLSTVTLTVLCAIYVGIIFPYLGIQSSKQALSIGLIWVALTVLFEFSLGRLTNKPWAVLLQDYNITTGHIWSLFLLSLFFLPYIFYSVRK
ncbi:MAG: hypothetical protein Q8927_06415 [Bacteroidota bacterium]|nr:hypothetical protein [Bacteroidota bacterium]MDP4247402.1 hypothetical protein [Bacteroidota bacterium]MDP4260320.1 hypothetical protein [Bacteroidota bacterium]